MSAKHPTTNKKAKRPLTPYNLFFRFKRIKIIQASSSGINDESSILELVQTTPGLENMSIFELERMHPREMHALRRNIVRQELQDKLLPFDGKRAHRKIPGTMAFAEMSRLMCDEWKLVDESTRSIFEELAEDGKRLHKERSLELKSTIVTHGAVRDDDFPSPSFNPIDQDSKTQSAASMPSRNVFDHCSMPSQCVRPRIRDVSADSNQCFASAHAVREASPCFGDHLHVASLSSKCTPLSYKTVNIVTPNPPRKSKTHAPDPTFDFNAVSTSEVEGDDSNDGDDFCRYIDTHIHLVDNEHMSVFDV